MTPDATLLLTLPATILAVELVLRLNFRAVLAKWTSVMSQSTALMRDKSLSDDDKQQKMAQASAATLGGTAKLFAIIVIALAGFVGVIWVGSMILVPDSLLSETLMRIDLQITSLAIALLYLWIRARVLG